MTEPRWLSADEAAAWRGLRQLQQALFRVLEQQMLTESQLSAADFEVLVPLSESAGQRLRARDLGLLMGWERSRLSHQLRRMELRDLISRVDCPTDARGTVIELSPAGRQAVESAAPSHVETVRRYFIDLLSPQEMATFAAVSDRVLERIRAEDTTDLCEGT